MFGPEIQRMARQIVQRLVGPLVRTSLTPNSLTALGVLLSAVTAIMLANGHLLAGGIMVLVAGAFDMLDGALARAKGMKSTFGAFYDSTLDRLSESIIYLGLAAWFLATGDQHAVMLVFVVIVGSLMISYARARAEGLGLECQVGMLARPERVVLLGAALLLDRFVPMPTGLTLLTVVLAALGLFSFFTLFHRIWHVWRLTLPEPAEEPTGQGSAERRWMKRGTRV